MFDFNEADEAAQKGNPLDNLAYQVAVGETQGVIDMYERAAWRCGCSLEDIDKARSRLAC